MIWFFFLIVRERSFGSIGEQPVWLQILGLGYMVGGLVVSVLGLWLVLRYLLKLTLLSRKAIGRSDQEH